MDDDDMFGEIRDPFERLNECEQGLVNHANHIEKLGGQVKTNAQLILQFTEHMKEVARVVDQIQRQQIYLFEQIKLLKDQNESKE